MERKKALRINVVVLAASVFLILISLLCVNTSIDNRRRYRDAQERAEHLGAIVESYRKADSLGFILTDYLGEETVDSLLWYLSSDTLNVKALQ